MTQQNELNTRALKAIIICVLISIIWTQLILAPAKKPQQPSKPAVAGTVIPQNSAPVQVAATAVSSTATTQPTVVQPQVPVAKKHPSTEELSTAGEVTVNTGVSVIRLTKLGGRVASYSLSDYKSDLISGKPLDMVDNLPGTGLPLGVIIGTQSDENVLYTLSSASVAPAAGTTEYAVPQDGALNLDFTGRLQDGTTIQKRISFQHNSYLFKVDVSLDKPALEPLWLEWSHYFPPGKDNPRMRLTHLTYLDGFDKIRHVQLTEIPEGMRDFGTSKWVSIGDLYFMSNLIPTVSGRNTILGREGDLLFARVAGTNSGGNFVSYIGPKDYRFLNTVGYGLERSIDLGWFTFLAYPLVWAIHYLYLLLGNYGLAIIALTLVVRFALLPLTQASLDSMKKMKEIQPEINALRERIKDPTQLNQEIFGLYKRKGVNPMGGCLPMLIQIPVFLGLYNALLNSIELRHQPFALWIKDLSAPEALNVFGVGVPVMVLMMATSMLIQQWTTPSTMDETQRKTMMIMPFVFAIMFIVFPMPAGLVLYWLTSNLISITQQIYLRNGSKGSSAYKATAIASMALFAFGYLLTLI